MKTNIFCLFVVCLFLTLFFYLRHQFCFDIFKDNDKYITKETLMPIFLEFLDYAFSKCQVKLFKDSSETEKVIISLQVILIPHFSSPFLQNNNIH